MKHNNFILAFVFSIFLIISGCASTTPLIKATKAGDSSAVQKLIDAGANINEQDNKGYTALFHAIEYGRSEIVKSLISKGANIEQKDLEGLTPLAYAIKYDRNADIIKLLINSGANIYAKTPEGETPLAMLLSLKSDIVNDLIRTGCANLWVPEAGKARLLFVGSGLWDYIRLTVGKQSRLLNPNKFTGLTLIDVDSGKHDIYAFIDKSNPEKPTSIDARTGQTYYFHVTQDMKKRAAHYAMIKLSSVMIIPLTEIEAKEEIKNILPPIEFK